MSVKQFGSKLWEITAADSAGELIDFELWDLDAEGGLLGHLIVDGRADTSSIRAEGVPLEVLQWWISSADRASRQAL